MAVTNPVGTNLWFVIESPSPPVPLRFDIVEIRPDAVLYDLTQNVI
jgi:hypothetical protein